MSSCHHFSPTSRQPRRFANLTLSCLSDNSESAICPETSLWSRGSGLRAAQIELDLETSLPGFSNTEEEILSKVQL